MMKLKGRCSLRPGSLSALSTWLVVAALQTLVSKAAAQTLPGNPQPVPPVPQLVPWVYDDNGQFVWKQHRFNESPGNTVFAIGRELATVPNQVGTYPEVLLCNYAEFDPPEGAPATTRRLASESVTSRGLQLYLNYSNALVDPADTSIPPARFATPTFFLSDGLAGQQTTPNAIDYGFNLQTISATRAAFGVFAAPVPPHSQVMQVAPSRAQGSDAALSAQVNAVFVTASIGYGLSDIDPQDQALAVESRRARLLVRDIGGNWIDQSTVTQGLLPTSVTGFNSSGVVFADLNGDGYMDLYVGMQGDNFNGAVDRILIFNPATRKFDDQTSTRIIGSTPLPANATNEVTAADVDYDGDLDIVSVGRAPRSGASGAGTDDVVLLNDGTGHFTVIPLVTLDSQGAPVLTDSRSVAIADLDHSIAAPQHDLGACAEIVIANAGGDVFSNVLDLPSTQNQPMQIFKHATGTVWNDVSSTYIDPSLEAQVTAPWSLQVLAVDVLGPPVPDAPEKWSPDGYPDLVIVNHRDILLSYSGTGQDTASNVHILRNRGSSTSGNRLQYGTAYPTTFGQTVTLEDFMHTGALHFFNGAGNRFVGALASMVWNNGPFTTLGQDCFLNFDDTYDLFPGTEHGYGFDFADYDENGTMDAGQTSRSYDFLAKDLGAPPGHTSWHLDLTASGSPQQITNQRGRMNPHGGEDLCFMKFDVDGPVHAIFVGQKDSSSTTPRSYPMSLNESALVCVLEKTPANVLNFLHEVVVKTLTGSSTNVFVDAKIDQRNRLAKDKRTTIADRVEVADMNNDGKPDAMVLYQGIGEGSPAQWKVMTPTAYPGDITTYLTGFSYLQNVRGDPGVPAGRWFKDVTNTSMKDASGVYSQYWNRGLGSLAIADFNNDGRLDFYTTNGRATNAGPGQEFESLEQLRDLLFMNASAPAAAGVLQEVGAAMLPPRVDEKIKDSITDAHTDSAGSFFITQGDVNNDGYADVIVTHCDQQDRTAPPSLYMNQHPPTGVGFADEYLTRVDLATFSTATVHSVNVDGVLNPTSPYGTWIIDNTWAVALADIDGDGDLDMLCAVGNNAPRILLNQGQDTDHNGYIDGADPAPSNVGHFVDVTDTAIPLAFPQDDANDIQAVDLDGDGDLDLAIDSFNGNVSLWRNNSPTDTKARITSVWPRVGAIRRNNTVIELQGKNFTGATTVRFRYPGGVYADVTGPNVNVVDDRRLRVTLQSTLPLGLALVQVKVGTRFSTQYFGYDILE